MSDIQTKFSKAPKVQFWLLLLDWSFCFLVSVSLIFLWDWWRNCRNVLTMGKITGYQTRILNINQALIALWTYKAVGDESRSFKFLVAHVSWKCWKTFIHHLWVRLLMPKFFLIFIVIQLQLYIFSPHPSTPPQLNPPPSPTSTFPLGFGLGRALDAGC